jgi:hypothetical protein
VILCVKGHVISPLSRQTTEEKRAKFYVIGYTSDGEQFACRKNCWASKMVYQRADFIKILTKELLFCVWIFVGYDEVYIPV